MDKSDNAKLVRKMLAASEFDSLQFVNDDDFEPYPIGNLVSFGSPDRRESWTRKIFDSAAPDVRHNPRVYYHFKSVSRTEDILKSGYIPANTLLSNRDNDYAEYEEFFRRYGSLFPLIPNDFKSSGSVIINAIGPSNRPVDEWKKKMFILCLTHSFNNERFWKDYVNCDDGVALELEYTSLPKEIIGTLPTPFGRESRTTNDLFEFRKVAYDTSGYLFDFLNELSSKYHAVMQEKYVLFIPGLTQIAAWYKRGRYRWENEVRIIFDWVYLEYLIAQEKDITKNKEITNKINDFVKIETEGDRNFVPIILHNAKLKKYQRIELANLTLKRIICGRKISPTVQTNLQKLADLNFSNVKVVSRDNA